MNNYNKTILMARPSMLPENICKQTGLPRKPPELVRCRQIGPPVTNTIELVDWLENMIPSYKLSYISSCGTYIMVACEIINTHVNENYRFIHSHSCTESETDNLFKESVHCAYNKVWRVSALNSFYSSDDIENMIRPTNICLRLMNFMKCQPKNIKVYVIEVL